MIPASLSFGVLADFKILGKPFFDFLDYLTSNIMLPLGTLAICLIGGWYAKHISKEAFGEGFFSSILNFLLKYIVPIIFILVFVLGLH